MKKAYKTEIRPTSEQITKIRQTIGVCRYVYNLYIAKNQEQYALDKTFISGMEFSKWLNNEHTQNHDKWIKEVSSKAVKKSIMNGEVAFKRFFKGLGKFPNFKKKGKSDVGAYFIQSSGNLKVQRHKIQIPTLGWVQLKEYGYIPKTAKSCTIECKADRYYISVLCDVEEKEFSPNLNDGIGIDLGIKDFAICSNHMEFKNINKSKEFKKLEKSLKRQQRKLSRKIEMNKNKKEGTKNRQKQTLKVQKLHMRLTNKRKEYVRYVVKCLVKTKPKYITIEDLNVKGMMKNRCLSKAVAQQNFYYFRTWLEIKCKESGIELRIVDRFYPSSKLCSCCGHKKVDLKLSDRTYQCVNCGAEMDRDFNASLNLKYVKEYTIITSR